MKSNRNKPVTLYIRGGLGNQMFQFACAYSYAKEFDRKLVINTDGYFGYKWNEDAGFIINQIIPELRISSNSKWSLFFSNGEIVRILGNILRNFFWQKGLVYKETELFVYDKELMKNGLYDGLYGYFQSPLYFEENCNIIISLIKLPISSKPVHNFKNIIENTKNSVAIHYRDYGDLVSGDENAKNIIGDVSIQYYKDAIQILNQKIENAHYFIFSNNINSAKEKFSEIKGLTFFNYKSDIKWEDMALMALCEHNIICNSSYSWWAAYLNSNEDKIVIAPKSWGNMLKEKERDNNLFPKDWILI